MTHHHTISQFGQNVMHEARFSHVVPQQVLQVQEPNQELR